MQEKENKKIKNDGDIFSTAAKVRKSEQEKRDKRQKELAKKEEKKREEYEQVLAEEKVEILKIKQGMEYDPNKLDLSPDEGKKYTLWQKFKNFIYHNKWWLGITSFLVFVVGVLVYDSITSVDTDINVLFLSDNTDIYYHYDGLTDFLNECIDDYNDDGEKYGNIIYVPISEDYETQVGAGGAYDTNVSKLSSEFQMGESMLIFADSQTDELILPETTLENLEELYPNDPNIKGYKFYLKDTEFAKLIGLDSEIPDDLYIGVRKITRTISPEKNTRKNHDLAIKTLEKIMDAVS